MCIKSHGDIINTNVNYVFLNVRGAAIGFYDIMFTTCVALTRP